MKKIETLAEYQQLASRTCPDLGSLKLNAFHMNSGVKTEVGEAIDPIKKFIAYGKPLDIVNVGEEMGDICWYIANKARMFLSAEVLDRSWHTQESFNKYSIDFEKTFSKDLENFENEKVKMIAVANLISSIDSNDADIDSFSEKSSVGVPSLIIINKCCELLNLDFWQILTNNIEKLQIRYPEKFTEEAALNRDLEAEREALEKTGSDDTAEN